MKTKTKSVKTQTDSKSKAHQPGGPGPGRTFANGAYSFNLEKYCQDLGLNFDDFIKGPYRE